MREFGMHSFGAAEANSTLSAHAFPLQTSILGAMKHLVNIVLGCRSFKLVHSSLHSREK